MLNHGPAASDQWKGAPSANSPTSPSVIDPARPDRRCHPGTERDQSTALVFCRFVVKNLRLLAHISDQAKAHLLKASLAAPAHPFRDILNDPKFDIFYHAPALVVIAAPQATDWAVEDCALSAGGSTAPATSPRPLKGKSKAVIGDACLDAMLLAKGPDAGRDTPSVAFHDSAAAMGEDRAIDTFLLAPGKLRRNRRMPDQRAAARPHHRARDASSVSDIEVEVDAAQRLALFVNCRQVGNIEEFPPPALTR